MSQVRLANPNDEDALVAHLGRVADQWGLRQCDESSFGFNVEKTRALIKRGIAKDGVWIGIIGFNDEIEASIGLHVAQPFFSDGSFIADLWTVVSPSYRQGDERARKLIAFAKEFASAADTPLVMGVVATERIPAKTRLFDSLVGQPPSGTFYVYQHRAQLEGHS